MDLFAILDSITNTKEDLLITEDDEREYSKLMFMVNNALSMNLDTVIYAQEMNKNPDISPKMHYDFLRLNIRKGKRYGKWAKKKNHEHIELIKEYYGVGDSKAIIALELLTDDEIKHITCKMQKGGKIK